MVQHQLPSMPYDFGALEPAISGQIMELHYTKHHQTYVNNLNAALDKYSQAEKNNDINEMILLQSAIRFNGGGHINHSIFWTNLAPSKEGGGQKPTKGPLFDALTTQFGSLDKFIEMFNATTVAIQGSGWGWVGLRTVGAKKEITIATCLNQDPPSTANIIPLLGIDVWEHAYYLQYKNVRADYLKKIWEVVNWRNVEERYTKALSA